MTRKQLAASAQGLQLFLADTGVTNVGRAHPAALSFAARSADVVSVFGLPLRGEITGFEQHGFGREARLFARGTIEGPDGSGHIRYEARAHGCAWSIVRGTVEVDASREYQSLSA